MHEFTLFNKMSHGRAAQFFSMSVLVLSLCTTSIGVAHAEQYCKSIDSNGSVSYTLAPETGCNKKKFKTVSVSHHITPVPSVTSKAADTTAKIPAGAPEIAAPVNPAPTNASPITEGAVAVAK
ncbi:hypothetical protein [Aquirhabdus sp.]|uniref:hypothetical protein n=1 Tax=Aquirhabdus sp. TaxID=2824160 RepID=UPI00396CB4C2